MASDQWTFWNQRLAGKKPEHQHGRAESGYWRYRDRKTGDIIGVHLWRESGGYLAGILNNGHAHAIMDELAFCENCFQFAMNHPVPAKDFADWRDTGTWPEHSIRQFEAEERVRRAEINARIRAARGEKK